jgi:hypothetical protein
LVSHPSAGNQELPPSGLSAAIWPVTFPMQYFVWAGSLKFTARTSTGRFSKQYYKINP